MHSNPNWDMSQCKSKQLNNKFLLRRYKICWSTFLRKMTIFSSTHTHIETRLLKQLPFHTVCIYVHLRIAKHTVAVKIKFPQRSDFTAEINGSVKSLTNSPVEQILKRLFKMTILILRTHPQQLEMGFPSMHAQLLPPTEQLPTGFLFLFLPSCHWK